MSDYPVIMEQATRSATGRGSTGEETLTAPSTIAPARHAPELLGQTVVVIGGSAGIGLETARRAREEGAEVILTARDPDRLRRVGLELGASIAALAVHLMTNTAVTGATFDIDGGQQLVEG